MTSEPFDWNDASRMSPHCRSFRVWLLGVALGVAAGCSDADEVYPVRGRLTVGGKPAAGAQLAFHSLDPRLVQRPVAITEPDGSFRLMTHAIGDGAPAGEYVVTIYWRDHLTEPDESEEGDDPVKHDRLRGLYFDSRKSPLRARVRPGPNEITIRADAPK